jgi:hypothetical protein
MRRRRRCSAGTPTGCRPLRSPRLKEAWSAARALQPARSVRLLRAPQGPLTIPRQVAPSSRGLGSCGPNTLHKSENKILPMSRIGEANFRPQWSATPVGNSGRSASRLCSLLIRSSVPRVCFRGNTTRVLPQSERVRHGIDFEAVPPCGFIACAMKLAVVDAAQRHGKFIRYLTAQCTFLRKADVMRVRWLPATH